MPRLITLLVFSLFSNLCWGAEKMKIQVDEYEHLWLSCKITDMKAKILINNSHAGTGEGNGSIAADFGVNLGIYGALPGENELVIQGSNFIKTSEIKCEFQNQKSLGAEAMTVKTITLKQKDFTDNSYNQKFLLVCKGYFPKLASDMKKFEELITKAANGDKEVVEINVSSLRKLLVDAKDEKEAKKVIDKWTRDAELAKNE